MFDGYNGLSVKSSENAGSLIYRAVNRYEIPPEQRVFDVRGYMRTILYPNFVLNDEGRRKAEKDKNFIPLIHADLSMNAQSDWFLEEGMDYKNRYGCEILLLGFQERQDFQRRYGDSFDEKEIMAWSLGVVKGLITPYSAKDDLFMWLGLNKGYHEKREKGIYRITPEMPGFERPLVDEWVDNKGLLKPDGKGSYTCPLDELVAYEMSTKHAYYGWLQSHGAFSMTYKPGQPRVLKFDREEVEVAFQKKWLGKRLKDKKDFYMISSEAEKTRAYPVPKKLTKYLNGEGPDPFPKNPVRPQPLKPIFCS